MTCTACGTRNPDGNRFCGTCGTRLAEACAACGAELQADQRFCGRCGTPVPVSSDAAPPRTGRAALTPVAERRLVSVLFADLVGFTTFSEGRDAEEVRDTLSRYFDIAKEAIGRYGGTVEKFIGDAVMAVWGTPTAHEDDAERAVRAALELLDAIHGLGSGITARAGVLTGEAAVTLGAVDQGMVAGDLVNTAARLQSVAAPGTVLVGDATYRAASAAIAFEPAGDHVLKGKEAPVQAWRALRVVAERGGRRRADGLEAPFTGRDEELRLLKDLFHATGRDGRARLVAVSGPAGIGKSRLAWEFEKYLDGVVETVWWHHGRSPASSGGVTFWALGEMVRARCGLLESDDEAHTRAKVAESLERFLPDPSEREWVEPAILQLLGVDVPVVSAQELFARWRVLFERLAETGSVVLVFEDLHWADPGTLDFIDHLLDWSKGIPLFVLTLARPELVDARPDWGVGRRSFVSVTLDPLGANDMRTLLAGLVPGLPERVVRGIVERAEGMPLYAVETVRMLLAEGRVRDAGGRYEPVGEIESLAVPETLTALIAARLDTLDPTDRALMLDASVLGQRFTRDALAAVAGMDAPMLEPRLRALVRRELLTLEADPRSPERGQFGFVQALIREVGYNTLARRDRKERHLAAARYFEQLGNDELAGALAGHYLAAHANAQEGPEADALAAQARVALRGAAERASALGSWAQAGEFLAQAVAATTQPEDLADLQERLGLALTSAGRHRDGIAAFEAAAAIHHARGDALAEARVLGALGEALNNGKDAVGAERALAPAIPRLVALGEDPGVLAMKGQLARSYFLQLRMAEAIRQCEEVLPQAERPGLQAVLADTLITKGASFTNIGRVTEGLALLAAGEQVAAEHGIHKSQLRSLNNRSVTIGEIDGRAAVAAGLAGLEVSRRIGSLPWTRSFAANVAWTAFRAGDWDLAEREVEPLLDEETDPADAVLILGNAIPLRLMRGQDVDDLLARLERTMADVHDAVSQTSLDESRAWVAFVEGRYADAERSWTAQADVGDSGMIYSRTAAAEMALLTGDRDRVAAHLAAHEAIDIHLPGILAGREAIAGALDALDGKPEALARMVAARKRLLDIGLEEEAGRLAFVIGVRFDLADPTVRDELAAARSFWDRVGARPMVARCDELLAIADSPPEVATA